MINIIKSVNNVNDFDYFFDDCESFFKAKVHSKSFTDDDLDVMSAIDNAVLLDKNIGTIKTSFGATYIDNLSSGCKVVLTYLYILRNKNSYKGKILLNVTECGSNALNVLFDLLDKNNKLDITLLLKHSNDLFKCKEHNYTVNGKQKRMLF